jgi:hypothetical protein
LQAVVHGFLEWIGVDLVHGGFSLVPGLLGPPAAGRRPVRRGGQGFRNIEERWLSCVVAGRDLRGGPAGAPTGSAACLAQGAVEHLFRSGDREEWFGDPVGSRERDGMAARWTAASCAQPRIRLSAHQAIEGQLLLLESRHGSRSRMRSRFVPGKRSA